jgi:hypothetical protein
VSLISDGRDTSERSMVLTSSVELLGTDTSAQNVFFATAGRLTPGDTDTQRDYYDARVDGGFPASAAPEPCASAEACHPGTSSAPLLGPLGSLTFSGPGNILQSVTPPVVKPASKPLTNAQKLAKALKACRRKHDRKTRVACERQARKKFGSAKQKKQAAKKKAGPQR